MSQLTLWAAAAPQASVAREDIKDLSRNSDDVMTIPVSLPDNSESALQLPPDRLRAAQLAEARVPDCERGARGAGQIEIWSVRYIKRFGARNSRRLFSRSRKSLKTEKSRFRWPGPRNTMRLALPNVWIGAPLKFGTVGGIANAAGLKYWSKPGWGPTAVDRRRGQDG